MKNYLLLLYMHENNLTYSKDPCIKTVKNNCSTYSPILYDIKQHVRTVEHTQVLTQILKKGFTSGGE